MDVLLQVVIWLGLFTAFCVLAGIWLFIALFVIGLILEKNENRKKNEENE